MKRRQFIQSMGIAALGAMVAPQLIPSFSAYARMSQRRIGHVVFCLFAGGVRNIESVHMDLGNLMPGMLSGALSSAAGVDEVINPLNLQHLGSPLQQKGTLFKEFRYAQGPPGHFNGHTVAITGVYTDTGLNFRENPTYPTIFEYYRKHSPEGANALNAWWISDSLGPYPALNYSRHPDYGPQFGANFIAPLNLFRTESQPLMSRPTVFDPDEVRLSNDLTRFLNQNFNQAIRGKGIGIENTLEGQNQIQDFILEIYQRGAAGEFNQPLGLSNPSGDVYHIALAEEVIKKFTPELTVVNMQNVDICHQNFTAYLSNLKKADYAVSHLWSTIQSTPGMADDTVLIIAPEHGRNFEANSVVDSFGRRGVDHTDERNYTTAKEIFCLVVGPPSLVKQNQVVGTPEKPVGESIDIGATIAHLLGFHDRIPSELKTQFRGRFLEEAFV